MSEERSDYTLYVDDSPECEVARSLLHEAGIKFEEIIVDRLHHPKMVVPYLMVIFGYDYAGLDRIKLFLSGNWFHREFSIVAMEGGKRCRISSH